MHEDEIEGLKLIKTNTFHDERGSFTRLYDCDQLQNELLMPKQMKPHLTPLHLSFKLLNHMVSHLLLG